MSRRAEVWIALAFFVVLAIVGWFTRSWTSVSAVATIAASVAAIVYVVLTQRLWAESAAQAQVQRQTRETELMLRLMTGYDDLRKDVITLQEWAGTDVRAKAQVFRDDRKDARQAARAYNIDDARFAISRFFVRIRKLNSGDYLSEDIIVRALDAQHLKLFLDLVDPLDEIAAADSYSTLDRDFFADVLRRRY